MENNYIKITNFGNNFIDQISSYMIMENDELFNYLKINEDDINDVDAKRLVDEVRKMYSRYH